MPPSRPHRFRPRAVLKWTGTSLCALIFAAVLVSIWSPLAVIHQNATTVRYAGLRTEVIVIGWGGRHALGGDVSRGWSVRTLAGLPKGDWSWLPYSGTRNAIEGTYLWVAVPLCMPLALFVLPTAWLFHRDRRHVSWAAAGRCVRCGYDLSGLPPGAACPECGKTAPL